MKLFIKLALCLVFYFLAFDSWAAVDPNCLRYPDPQFCGQCNALQPADQPGCVSQCMANQQISADQWNSGPCQAKQCPDGSYVSLTEACPEPPVKCPDGSAAPGGDTLNCPKQCPDGTSVPGLSNCPPPPPPPCPNGTAPDGSCPTPPCESPNSLINGVCTPPCPDGGQPDSVTGSCSPPHTCPDGSQSIHGACPTDPCPDGSPAPSGGSSFCPKQCNDGSVIFVYQLCPGDPNTGGGTTGGGTTGGGTTGGGTTGGGATGGSTTPKGADGTFNSGTGELKLNGVATSEKQDLGNSLLTSIKGGISDLTKFLKDAGTTVFNPSTADYDKGISDRDTDLSETEHGFSFLPTSITVPTSDNCQPITLHYNSFFVKVNTVLNPCERLLVFKHLFGWFLATITVFYIYSLAIKD